MSQKNRNLSRAVTPTRLVTSNGDATSTDLVSLRTIISSLLGLKVAVRSHAP